MAKQTFKIQGFHGGLNSNADPRDIRPDESPSLKDIAIDSVGRLKTLGSVDDGNIYHSGTALGQTGTPATTSVRLAASASASDDYYSGYSIIITSGLNVGEVRTISSYDASGHANGAKTAIVSSGFTDSCDATSVYEIVGDANTIAISQNRGLFVMSSDRQLDAGVADETLIFCFDSGSNTIDIKDSEGWDTAKIDMKGSAVPSYYAADGVVRVSDTTFARNPQWFGYIADQRLGALNAAGPTAGWFNVAQSIKAPTLGTCLISTPMVGSDSNGIFSSDSEYIGTVIDDGGSGDVVDHSAVNLRVGVQLNEIIVSGSSAHSTPTNSSKADSTDIYPCIGNLTTKFTGASTTNTYSGFGAGSLDFDFSENECLLISIFFTTTEYNSLKNIKLIVDDGVAGTNPNWSFGKEQIKPNMWNILVCSGDNISGGSENFPTSGSTSVVAFVYDTKSSGGAADKIDFYLSGIALAEASSIDGFTPGSYTFHHTYLYDAKNKQESLPFTFSGVDSGSEPDNVNSINVVGSSVLFNFDAYICAWSNPIAAAVDVSEHYINHTSHGLVAGDIVRLGAMSGVSGIDTSTDYYVSSQSLVANSFRVSTNLANAIAGTSIDLSGSDDGAITYIKYNFNERISGSRLYYKVEENDNYFLIGELDFIGKGFKWLPEADTNSYNMANTSDATYPILSKTAVVKGISPDSANVIETFKIINGFSSEVNSLSAQFKTAVVHGRRTYIGNISQDGETHPDRILKSQINRFDTFPEGMGSVDVVIRDGENIVKLEAFADRILQFKEHSLYIINVSETVDFLEDTYRNKGCAFDYHVTKTDMGIAWFNDHGVYIYDGKRVLDLLEKDGMRLINEDDWSTFIKDGTDDTDMSSAMIGYIPKKRQILIKNENNDVYIYDFVLRAWTTGIGKITESTAMTNFALDADQNLFYIDNTTTVRKTWQVSSQSSTGFEYRTPDIDFGEPGVRKKVYKVYVTYKSGATTNVQVDYDVNGGTTFPYDFANGTNFTSNELANASGWQVAELKPDNSTESNNIKSFQLRFATDGTVPSGFEINDITIVYRMKNIR